MAPLLTPRTARDRLMIAALVWVALCLANPDDGLYYMGWNVGGSVPWRNAIGVAVGSVESGRFERFSAGPIMDRDPVDHYSLSYPCVLNAGAGTWVMWYRNPSCLGSGQSGHKRTIRRYER